jgi:hypothetical protein
MRRTLEGEGLLPFLGWNLGRFNSFESSWWSKMFVEGSSAVLGQVIARMLSFLANFVFQGVVVSFAERDERGFDGPAAI